MEDKDATMKAARALGKAFGLLNSLKPIDEKEMALIQIRPMLHFPKIHNQRIRKFSEEKTKLMADIFVDVPADFGSRPLTLAEQGEFQLGFYQWQKGGRPTIAGSAMPVRQIRIDDDLWEKVKAKAEENGIKISEAVREALAQYCK